MMNRLIWAALGAFAVGTEGFLITPLLPEIATDLGVAPSVIGLSVTVFAATYALGSPIAAALTANIDRARLLVAALGVFILGNLLAAVSTGAVALMIARIVAALGAGLYMPAASAAAVLIAPPERRGRAIALVMGGVTVAVAAGAPLGAWIGHLLGWRAAFFAVAGLSTIAATAIRLRLPVGMRAPVASLRERIETAGRPEILGGLTTTVIWSAGGFTLYTYLAPFMIRTADASPAAVDLTILVFGVAAAIGVALGGWAVDRFGPESSIRVSLGGMIAAMAAIAVGSATVEPAFGLWYVTPAMFLWGVSGWAFNPIQGVRLVRRDPAHAGTTLALNASALQLGAGAGAALGSWMIAALPVERLAPAATVLLVIAAMSLSWGRSARTAAVGESV